MIVAVPTALGRSRHVRPAVTACSGDDALGPLDRLGTGLSGVSANGRVLPSRDGRGLLDALPTLALPRPNPSFEGGTCELLDVLRGRPTSASSSCIRNACCSIRSCCCASSASFSTSLNLKRGRSGMLQVNQIAAPAATPLSQPISSYGSYSSIACRIARPYAVFLNISPRARAWSAEMKPCS